MSAATGTVRAMKTATSILGLAPRGQAEPRAGDAAAVATRVGDVVRAYEPSPGLLIPSQRQGTPGRVAGRLPHVEKDFSLARPGVAPGPADRRAEDMQTVRSIDGTTIAFDRAGGGPLILFVTGAFNDRATCADVAKLLSDRFTVVTYDRRGRGDSTDTAPYSIDREIEDIDALINAVGGPACVFGFSSGALLALMAAAHGLAIDKVVAYEAPLPLEDDPQPADLPEQLAELLSQDRRGDAVERFQRRGIGLDADTVAQIRRSPFWPALEAMAPTAVYDAMITRRGALPTDTLATIATPTLVLTGGETWDKLGRAAQRIADVMPNTQLRALAAGRDHQLVPELLAPELASFFSNRHRPADQHEPGPFTD